MTGLVLRQFFEEAGLLAVILAASLRHLSLVGGPLCFAAVGRLPEPSGLLFFGALASPFPLAILSPGGRYRFGLPFSLS